jgi:hypothetical protein
LKRRSGKCRLHLDIDAFSDFVDVAVGRITICTKKPFCDVEPIIISAAQGVSNLDFATLIDAPVSRHGNGTHAWLNFRKALGESFAALTASRYQHCSRSYCHVAEGIH